MNNNSPVAGRLEVSSPIEGMQVSLAAYKSLVSDYALRAKQAEDMVSTLMLKNIPEAAFMDMVVNKINDHIDSRGIERSTQFLGVLQTTLIALTNTHQNIDTRSPDQIKSELVEIIKAITVAVAPSN